MNKYVNFINIFNKITGSVLLFYKENLNYIIKLILSKSLSFKLLYNLSEYKLGIFKKYINKNLKSDYINIFKLFIKTSILFIKK